MAESKIEVSEKSWMNHQSGSKSISANTNTTIVSFTINTPGNYVIMSHMNLSASNSNSYNHNITAAGRLQTVRSTALNGGGSMNCIALSVIEPQTVTVQVYSPVACTATAYVWYVNVGK